MLTVFFGYTAFAFAGSICLNHLRTEYLENPLGIDEAQPQLSWIIRSDQRGERQMAYQILVAASLESLRRDQGDLWDTGKVASDQSIHIEYRGKPLKSHQPCWWKVRVWNKDNQPTAWSEPAFWSMGILDPKLWTAKWLTHTEDLAYDVPWTQSSPSPMFRKTFRIKQTIRSATISICGLGFYELYLNGHKVGDHVLDPAFTRYDKRALYITYDVTDQLKQGLNAVGVMLGNGWYNSHSRCVWDFDKAPWRDQPKLLFQLRIIQNDSSVQTVVSDDSWKATIGPVVRDGIRNGEVYDIERRMAGLATPNWQPNRQCTTSTTSQPIGNG